MSYDLSTISLINEKVTGFFIGALDLGYSYDDAWSLLLNSKQGQGILNNEYAYSVHHQGRVSADKADADIGYKYKKDSNINATISQLELLADFISLAHNRFNIKYTDMFKNIPLSEFISTCGNVLGNYDDKLIKVYILNSTS